MNRHFLLLSLTFSIFFNSTTLNASVYDDDILNMFSKIAPRFVLMSNQKNTLKDKIEICILHDEIDEKYAVSLMEKISSNYPNGIKNYKLKLINSNYAHLELCQNSQLAFLFDTDDKSINKTIKFSNEHTIFTISYEPNYLEKGVNGSLFLGKKVIPYLNMSSLQKSGIKLDNVLVQISKIYSQEEGK